jgi:hypothetical protein
VALLGSVIELRYSRPEIDCAVVPTDKLFMVPLGTLPAGTYHLRLLEAHDPTRLHLDDEAIFAVSPSPCAGVPGGDSEPPSLCLAGGRFAVTVEWTSRDGKSGVGHPLPLTAEAGAFWLSRPASLEVMARMLDACGRNGRFWFFLAGVTNPNLGVTVRVREVATGVARTYTNPVGKLFQPVRDVETFACAAP